MYILKDKCKNMSSANGYVRQLLKQFNENINIDNEEIFSLICYHPTKQINKNNIEWLRMKNRKPFNQLALTYKYKNSEIEDDISWKLCIRNMYGKYKRDEEYIKNVHTAFRNESHNGTKKEYFIKNTSIENDNFVGVCELCKLKTKNITTDHYPFPYKNTLCEFETDNKIKISDIDIYENENNLIRIKDKKIARNWLFFHDQIATYRLLCNTCNSKMGSYGF